MSGGVSEHDFGNKHGGWHDSLTLLVLSKYLAGFLTA